MKKTSPSFVEFLIVFYTALQCQDLLIAWNTAYLDYLGWLAFLIWVSPVVVHLLLKPIPVRKRSKSATALSLITLGLFLSLMGTLGSLNALHHAGFAFAIGGLLPFSLANFVWLSSAISWTPALGWISSHFLTHILAFRLFLASIGAACLFSIRYLVRRKVGREKG